MNTEKYRISLRRLQSEGSAILACNFYNAETLMGVLQAAQETSVEIILQTSPSTLRYLGIPFAVGMARAAARQLGVHAWLHLDHASDFELINQCIDAGYDSVMVDASEENFETNVQKTREVVEQAHASGVLVEAELGYVPKLGQESARESGFTSPQEAARFVRETEVDLLAIAAGTAHGFYKQPPRLDFQRIADIRAAVEVPLVLHGGSGLTEEDWRKAIGRGIVKINFATEIKNAFIREVKTQLSATDEIDLRKTFPPAIGKVKNLVEEKLRICLAGSVQCP